MATIKSYTDIEQSKKLAEILPLESADMHWQDASKEYKNPYGIYDRYFRLAAGNSSKIINNKRDFRKGFILPAWSVSALLDVLPDELEDNHFLTLSKEGAEYCCCYEDINGNSFRHTFANNAIDACYELILKLHERELL